MQQKLYLFWNIDDEVLLHKDRNSEGVQVLVKFILKEPQMGLHVFSFDVEDRSWR